MFFTISVHTSHYSLLAQDLSSSHSAILEATPCQLCRRRTLHQLLDPLGLLLRLNIMERSQVSTEELLSFRDVPLERDKFSVRCGLEGICIPGCNMAIFNIIWAYFVDSLEVQSRRTRGNSSA
ncbi:hypothetical protein YC2023_103730 [Brassica napus]